MVYQSWSVVFGEQPSSAKWNILGANDASFNDGTGITDGVIKPEHLKDGSSTLNSWVWDSWTPTLSGRFNDAKWTKSCKYIRIGNIIIATFSIVANTTTPMDGGVAECIFTLPVTSVALVNAVPQQQLGGALCFDANGDSYPSHVGLASTTTAIIRYQAVSGANVVKALITSAAPFTWTTSDEMGGTFIYQAAA